MVVLTIHGFCQKCGSQGSIHLIVRGDNDFGWYCDNCLSQLGYSQDAVIITQ
jgi:hypothetical protein